MMACGLTHVSPPPQNPTSCLPVSVPMEKPRAQWSKLRENPGSDRSVTLHQVTSSDMSITMTSTSCRRAQILLLLHQSGVSRNKKNTTHSLRISLFTFNNMLLPLKHILTCPLCHVFKYKASPFTEIKSETKNCRVPERTVIVSTMRMWPMSSPMECCSCLSVSRDETISSHFPRLSTRR